MSAPHYCIQGHLCFFPELSGNKALKLFAKSSHECVCVCVWCECVCVCVSMCVV